MALFDCRPTFRHFMSPMASKQTVPFSVVNNYFLLLGSTSFLSLFLYSLEKNTRMLTHAIFCQQKSDENTYNYILHM